MAESGSVAFAELPSSSWGGLRGGSVAFQFVPLPRLAERLRVSLDLTSQLQATV